MPIKRRTYNPRRVRRAHAYLAQEAADLFGLHKNAVLNWVGLGLKTIDGKKPMMIHGSDLIDFLTRRQQGRKRACQPDEFYCCKCRKPKQVWEGLVDLTQLKKDSWLVRGLCTDCSTKMQRIYPAKKLPEVRRLFKVQTVNEEHINESSNPPVNRDFKPTE